MQPTGGDLNPQPKLASKKPDDELCLDELTQEDKFFLIQQIESTMHKRNVRYNSNTMVYQDDDEPPAPQSPKVDSGFKVGSNSLEIIEDCAAEDLEDEIIPKQVVQPKRPF